MTAAAIVVEKSLIEKLDYLDKMVPKIGWVYLGVIASLSVLCVILHLLDIITLQPILIGKVINYLMYGVGVFICAAAAYVCISVRIRKRLSQ